MKRKILFTSSIFIIIYIIVFLIPIVINELFKTGKGYVVVWDGADVLAFYGAILSFFGASALSVIALYQNKKFKSENDKAQTRLESISNRSNEMASINIIVAHETKRIDDLANLLNQYQEVSNTQNMGIGLYGDADLYVKIAKIENRLDMLSIEITQAFKRDKELFYNQIHPLKVTFFILNSKVKDFLEELKRNGSPTADFQEHNELWRKFITESQKYLICQREKIDRILYDEVSLADVKEMYAAQIKNLK